jgi:hypothetical protein
MSRIQSVILRELIHNDEFMRKSVPFLRSEYFVERVESLVFQNIADFIDSFKVCPTVEALEIRFDGMNGLAQDEIRNIHEYMEILRSPQPTKQDWLLRETETFCKTEAIRIALSRSIKIADGRDKDLSADAIPGILQEALGVCFDSGVGHDYLIDAQARHEYYHNTEERIPFDIDILNDITQGGIPRKTLNVIMGGILVLCHLASAYMDHGKNVLYITMEMREEEISKRIDANLMNVSIRDMKEIPSSMFMDRIERIKNRSKGRLIVKEFPTASAHVGHFRALLSELSLKKQFVPDVICVDYINICASSRFKFGGNVNSYTYIKGIAEELRGLAMEFNVPIWTGTQVTRLGFASSDAEMTDTAESFGLPATADFMISLFMDETLEKMGQYAVKQLKNRYDDLALNRRFNIGVDKIKMRLYNVEPSAQRDILNARSEEPKGPISVTSKRFGDRNFGELNTES